MQMNHYFHESYFTCKSGVFRIQLFDIVFLPLSTSQRYYIIILKLCEVEIHTVNQYCFRFSVCLESCLILQCIFLQHHYHAQNVIVYNHFPAVSDSISKRWLYDIAKLFDFVLNFVEGESFASFDGIAVHIRDGDVVKMV